MKNTKSVIGLAAVFVLLAIGGWFVTATEKTNVSLGATSVQATDGDCLLAPGGGHVCAYTTSITATSSVLCAFKSPAATSTLSRPWIKTVSLGGLATTDRLFVSTSTTALGSTTPFIGFTNLATNLYAPFSMDIASTSTWQAGQLITISANGVSADVIAPNTWLTFKTSSTTPSVFSSYPTGQCGATFVY